MSGKRRLMGQKKLKWGLKFLGRLSQGRIPVVECYLEANMACMFGKGGRKIRWHVELSSSNLGILV